MTLDEEDFEQIQHIASQMTAESQEMLAGMIARQFLTIRQQFEEIQQQVRQVQKQMEESLADLRLDLSFLKKHLEELEGRIIEAQKETAGRVKESERIWSMMEQIHEETHQDLEKRLGVFEHRIQKLEPAVA